MSNAIAIASLRFHGLRHTFATLAIQNGVDIKTVSGMLGHSGAGFTLDTYAQIKTSGECEAAAIGNILSKAGEVDFPEGACYFYFTSGKR